MVDVFVEFKHLVVFTVDQIETIVVGNDAQQLADASEWFHGQIA